MKYLILIMMFSVVSCTTKIIRKPFVPKITCPVVEKPVYEKFELDDNDSEILKKLQKNLEKSIKYIEQLKTRLECYEKTLDKYKDEEIKIDESRIEEIDRLKDNKEE